MCLCPSCFSLCRICNGLSSTGFEFHSGSTCLQGRCALFELEVAGLRSSRLGLQVNRHGLKRQRGGLSVSALLLATLRFSEQGGRERLGKYRLSERPGSLELGGTGEVVGLREPRLSRCGEGRRLCGARLGRLCQRFSRQCRALCLLGALRGFLRLGECRGQRQDAFFRLGVLPLQGVEFALVGMLHHDVAVLDLLRHDAAGGLGNWRGVALRPAELGEEDIAWVILFGSFKEPLKVPLRVVLAALADRKE
mmetsp:Transcript_4609/g.14616  ORF Transcript_4609/g.14616 Transcript_4609/m.14616 type:complete len:251 (+) Transcript_4609:110-862(+)